jgi:hypothetical protein
MASAFGMGEPIPIIIKPAKKEANEANLKDCRFRGICLILHEALGVKSESFIFLKPFFIQASFWEHL